MSRCLHFVCISQSTRQWSTWNYCCSAPDFHPRQYMLEWRSRDSGNRRGMGCFCLRAIIRISTRAPEAASTANIASCIRRLGCTKERTEGDRQHPTDDRVNEPDDVSTEVWWSAQRAAVPPCLASTHSRSIAWKQKRMQVAISLAGRMKSERHLVQSSLR